MANDFGPFVLAVTMAAEPTEKYKYLVRCAGSGQMYGLKTKWWTVPLPPGFPAVKRFNGYVATPCTSRLAGQMCASTEYGIDGGGGGALLPNKHLAVTWDGPADGYLGSYQPSGRVYQGGRIIWTAPGSVVGAALNAGHLYVFFKDVNAATLVQRMPYMIRDNELIRVSGAAESVGVVAADTTLSPWTLIPGSTVAMAKCVGGVVIGAILATPLTVLSLPLSWTPIHFAWGKAVRAVTTSRPAYYSTGGGPYDDPVEPVLATTTTEQTVGEISTLGVVNGNLQIVGTANQTLSMLTGGVSFETFYHETATERWTRNYTSQRLYQRNVLRPRDLSAYYEYLENSYTLRETKAHLIDGEWVVYEDNTTQGETFAHDHKTCTTASTPNGPVLEYTVAECATQEHLCADGVAMVFQRVGESVMRWSDCQYKIDGLPGEAIDYLRRL
ncbi:MAG: hypothetical protein HQL56_13500 [Magnetococcales bacterium]|nr:hypothetical protein [Magnetococcales bacterium]